VLPANEVKYEFEDESPEGDRFSAGEVKFPNDGEFGSITSIDHQKPF